MASSITNPALSFCADTAIVAARPALAMVGLFATDFSHEAVKPGTTMKIPVFTPDAAAAFNKTSNNYETTDGSVTFADVTFDKHLKHTFSFDDTDMNEVNLAGSFWQKAGEASGNALALAIAGTVSGMINKTKIPKSAANEVILSSVTKQSIAKLRGSCFAAGIDPARTVLMLTPAAFGDLLALFDANVFGGPEAVRNGIIPRLYGFKAVCENGSLSSDTNEKLVGALVPEDAIVVAGRTIEVGSRAPYDEVGYQRDEVSGITLGLRRHGNPATGENFLNLEALFGSNLVQPTKIVRLVSAATA